MWSRKRVAWSLIVNAFFFLDKLTQFSSRISRSVSSDRKLNFSMSSMSALNYFLLCSRLIFFYIGNYCQAKKNCNCNPHCLPMKIRIDRFSVELANIKKTKTTTKNCEAKLIDMREQVLNKLNTIDEADEKKIITERNIKIDF